MILDIAHRWESHVEIKREEIHPHFKNIKLQKNVLSSSDLTGKMWWWKNIVDVQYVVRVIRDGRRRLSDCQSNTFSIVLFMFSYWKINKFWKVFTSPFPNSTLLIIKIGSNQILILLASLNYRSRKAYWSVMMNFVFHFPHLRIKKLFFSPLAKLNSVHRSEDENNQILSGKSAFMLSLQNKHGNKNIKCRICDKKWGQMNEGSNTKCSPPQFHEKNFQTWGFQWIDRRRIVVKMISTLKKY